MMPTTMRLLLGLAFIGASLFAQVATLTGRISDPSGAVIPQAKITVRAKATGIVTSTETTAEG